MADDKPNDKPEEPDPKRTERQRESLVRTEGSLERALDNLIDQTANLRRANRELKDKLPKDGEVVLSKDDAKAWGEFQKLNLPIAEIGKKIAEGSAAQQKLTLMERDRLADDAAKLMNWHAPTLRAVTRLHNLNLQFQDVTDPDGAVDEQGKKKKIRVPVILPEGEDQDPVPLDEYVEEHLGDFREALAGSETERTNGHRESPPEKRIIRQRSGDRGPGGVSREELDKQVASRLPFTSV